MHDYEEHTVEEKMRIEERQKRREQSKEKRRKERIRNRVILTSIAFVIIILIMVGIVSAIFGGGSEGDGNATQPTQSGSSNQNTTQDPTEDGTQGSNEDPTQNQNEDPTQNSNEDPTQGGADEKPTQGSNEEPTQGGTGSAQSNVITDNGKDGEMMQGIYVWNNAGYELFYGGEGTAKTYAKRISEYKNQLGDDVTVYNMVIPNHTEFGLPERLAEELLGNGTTLSQKTNTNAVYKNYTSDVKAVDIYNVFDDHKGEYLYFNTDHHWTSLGGYYAYTEFAKVAGLKPVALEDCVKKSVSGFTGSFCTITGSQALYNNADRVDYYELPIEYTCIIDDISSQSIDMYYPHATGGSNTYGLFIWGDNPTTIIDNKENNSGEKIAVIKESYGNAIAPYFSYNYDETHIIDFRHFEGNLKTYCEVNDIDNVIFINGVMSANTPMQLSSMDSLFE